MFWYLWFVLSLLFFLSSVVFAFARSKTRYKRGRILDPSKILLIGVVVSSFVLFIPVYYVDFGQYASGVVPTILASLHNMIRLFIVDGEFGFIADTLQKASPPLLEWYLALFGVLFVMAPILTFGFVLSFFKNLSAYKQYFTHFKSNAFIFSELNEKSLALATDLSKKPEKRILIFTGVFEGDKETDPDFIEEAKEIGAICFKKDIASIDFSLHSKKSSLTFFAIGDNELKNTENALVIIDKYKYRDKTDLYVSSTEIETEMILTGAIRKDRDNIKIKLRRINEVQTILLQNLYKNGYEKIFKSAYDDNSGTRKINAVIIGLGWRGTEMLKSLSWFCQMDGYLPEINAFDISPNAEQDFTSLCPELMKFSGKTDIDGENRYTIKIHSGVDVSTSAFDEMISKLPPTTYAFVSLGDDERNIAVSSKLRSLFERNGCHPEIQAVVRNSDNKNVLAEAVNFKGQKYNIDYIGDVRSVYSEDGIMNSEVEKQALNRHLKWGNENDFWHFNYNYKSSVASAIHHEMKILCGIPGIKNKPDERTEEELWGIRILEHRRWNAYMRSEGYSYGGTLEKSGRNDLAKLHNCLVPFADLPLSEQEKDDD